LVGKEENWLGRERTFEIDETTEREKKKENIATPAERTDM